jgi:hypothetical protein
METTRSSFCRCCLNRCAIRVTVEDGRATKVTGDRDDPLYGGYTCIKGRSQPQFLYGDDRLLTSLKRLPDGRFAPIPVEQAIDETTVGYGLGVSYANYTPAVADVPAGSDLIEEWGFFAGLYERVEAGLRTRDEEVTERSPLLAAEDTEDLLDIVSAGSRISLAEVRSNEHGRICRRPDTDDLVREVGTNANRLVATDAVYDRYTGQPRMSNVPVKITKRGDAT